MKKGTKIFLIVLSSIVTGVGGYLLYNMIRRRSAYTTVVSENQAVSIINQVGADVPDINPADYQTEAEEPANMGVMLGNEDEADNIGSATSAYYPDAVLINGVVYVGDWYTGLYYSQNGAMYDDYTNKITVNGYTMPVDKSSVIYGTATWSGEDFSVNQDVYNGD